MKTFIGALVLGLAAYAVFFVGSEKLPDPPPSCVCAYKDDCEIFIFRDERQQYNCAAHGDDLDCCKVR